jgi:hypothetical protein
MKYVTLTRPISNEFWQVLIDYAKTDSQWALTHVPKKGTLFSTQNDSLFKMVLENFGESK